MYMKRYCLVPFWALLGALFLTSCSGKKDDPDNPTPGGGAVRYEWVTGKPSAVFSFAGENRYAYCPSVIEDGAGNGHIYFCAAAASDQFTDHIYYAPLEGGRPKGTPVPVLKPGLDWDSRHVCDPCILEGRFSMDGTDYRYALFFLSNPLEYYYNEIGVAFSNSLGSGWTKYPKQLVSKPWDHDGDDFYSETGRCWGVGQVSAVSLDKRGRILLTYTKGARDGTRVVWREADLSDMSAPVLGEEQDMVRTGLTGLDGRADWTCNFDFALSDDARTLLAVRPVQPHPTDYPAYIPSVQEVCTIPWTDFRAGKGSWTPVLRIDAEMSGYPRNHNACLGRDSFGRLQDPQGFQVYFTVSEAAPDVAPSDGKHAEWTYAIWRVAKEKTIVKE